MTSAKTIKKLHLTH